MKQIAQLTAVISADTRQFSAAMSRVRKEMNAAGGETRGLGAKLSSFGASSRAVGGAMVKGLTLPILAAGAASVKLASDAAETASKLEVTFGKGTKSVTKELDRFAKATGSSRYALREQAATIGALLKPMGLSSDAMADMSLKTVKLAKDLSSFHNISEADALQKLRAGLTGEAEPLKQLGILMNDDAVQAEALRMGLVKMQVDHVKVATAQAAAEKAQARYSKALKEHGARSIEARAANAALIASQERLSRAFGGKAAKLSESAKLQARYSIILRQSADAQGDATRTAGGFANQSKALSNAMRDLGTDIGQILLPYALKLVAGLKGLSDRFNKLSPRTKKIVVVVGGLAAVMGPLLIVIGAMASGISALGAVFGAFGAVAAIGLGPLLLIAAGIAAVGAAIYLLLKHRKAVAKFFGHILDTVKRALGPIVAAAKKLGAMVWGAIKAYFRIMFFPYKLLWNGIKKAAGVLGPAAKALGGGVCAALKGAFAVMTFPSRMLLKAIKGAGGLLGKAAHALGGGIIKRLWEGMKALGAWLKGKLYDLIVAPVAKVAKKLHIDLPDLGLGGGGSKGSKGGGKSGKGGGSSHSSSSSGGSGKGGGGIVINNVFKGDVSEERVVALMSSALRRYA